MLKLVLKKLIQSMPLLKVILFYILMTLPIMEMGIGGNGIARLAYLKKIIN